MSAERRPMLSGLSRAVVAALSLRRHPRREPMIGLVDLGRRRRHADRIVSADSPSGYDDDRPGRTWTYKRF